MSENSDNPETRNPPPPPRGRPPPPPPEADDDGGDDEGRRGPRRAAQASAGGAARTERLAARPAGQGGRRRRRRRRRRGAQVHFTPEGQAYRMAAGPGRPAGAGLPHAAGAGAVPASARPSSNSSSRSRRPARRPGAPARRTAARRSSARRPHAAAARRRSPSAQLVPVEGVLDTEAKGPNAFLRQVEANLLAVAGRRRRSPRTWCRSCACGRASTSPRSRRCAATRASSRRWTRWTAARWRARPGCPTSQDLTSVDPIERLKLENGHKRDGHAGAGPDRALGKGQRALIVAPPKTGKTIMLQRIAQAVIAEPPGVPRDGAAHRRAPGRSHGHAPQHQGARSSPRAPTGPRATTCKVAELALERARRLVESGKDVVILLDSITRLARAYNKEVDSLRPHA